MDNKTGLVDFKDTLCINPSPFILDHIPTIRAHFVRNALRTLRAVLAINRRSSKDKDSTVNKTEDRSKKKKQVNPGEPDNSQNIRPFHLINR